MLFLGANQYTFISNFWCKKISVMDKIIHQGRNVKRFREMLQVKQEALALDLGGDWSQRKISILEQKEVIDDQVLEAIAKALNVPANAIRNFDEEIAVNVISNTFENGNNTGAINNINSNCTLNSNLLEKNIDLTEENLKLNIENKALYERLIQAEKEKVVFLERLLK